MKILWGNHVPLDQIHKANGFGYATERIISSLRSLGHEVSDVVDSPDVEIWFEQPHWVKWKSDAYRVLYVPWESTELLEGWLEVMNTADEVWTPSQTVSDWFVEAGVNVPVHVYLHGVDKIWRPVERVLGPSFNLFHHGGEACRKGWVETASMFRDVFLDKPVEMNFKMLMSGWNIKIPHVNIMEDKMPIDELVSLYQRMHMMVYPSWGEGFGLTPLQAIATGMPVLITRGWAPYEQWLPPECLIDTTLVDSPWPNIHPGKMLRPDYADMAEKALFMYENYSDLLQNFDEIGAIVRREFDWNDLTHKMFSDLENRLKLVAS